MIFVALDAPSKDLNKNLEMYIDNRVTSKDPKLQNEN
jgi:hypothetical protein